VTADIGLYAIIKGAPLTNSGTITFPTGGGGLRYLRVAFTNNGTVKVASPDVAQDAGTATVNNGKFLISDGGHYALSGGSFTNAASATFGATINSATGVSGLTGGSVALDGTLKITTVGAPALASVYDPISTSTVSGTFTALDFGVKAYAATYSPTATTLTTRTPFAIHPSAFTLKQGIADVAGTIVATVTDTTPAAPYTVTVDWGDATITPGTFTNSATGGTARGKHAYALPGAYTVKTTIHSADGTTKVGTAIATVTP
jgi:hypothetical protein